MLTIVGEAGAGKSRLVDEALPHAGEHTVIRVQSEQSGSTAAYRGLRDPIRALLGIERGEQDDMAAQLRDAVADRAPHLLPMLPLLGDVVHVDVASTPEVDSIDVRFRPARTGDAVVELLDAFARRARWSWSSTTRNGWTALRRNSSSAWRAPCRARPWLLLVVRRPGGGGPDLPDIGADRARAALTE